MNKDHVLRPLTRIRSGEWTAKCSCGWKGHIYAFKVDAIDEWENHCVEWLIR